MATSTRKASLTPAEARALHFEALVIDTQQPGATSGFLFTDRMRASLHQYAKEGMKRAEATALMQAMAAWEVQTSEDARRAYLDFWRRSGVNVASGTYAGPAPFDDAFERSVKAMAEAHGILNALEGELFLVLKADDIETAHRSGRFGLILDFQDTTPFGSDLKRIELFYNLGLRVVQLTYNLRNLAGDGCTEKHKSGLTYFGREIVERLNEMNMVVDVSHCSEQVGWDALDISTAPIMVTHSASAAVCYHDRGKSDALARAIADKGGFFGVAVIAGFLQESTEATLDDFADHVEHLVDVMGIDHVGIGSDKTGPGPGTESQIQYPKSMGAVRPLRQQQGGRRLRGRRRAARLRLERLQEGAPAERRAPRGRLRRLRRLAEPDLEAGGARFRRDRASQAARPQLPARLPRHRGIALGQVGSRVPF